MKSAATTVLSLIVFAAPAVADELPILTGRDVVVRLSRDVGPQQFYPQEALHRGISGDASALCTIGPGGALEACEVETEIPTGLGFGTAMLKLTKIVRVGATTRDGSQAAGRHFRFEMHFRLPHS